MSGDQLPSYHFTFCMPSAAIRGVVSVAIFFWMLTLLACAGSKDAFQKGLEAERERDDPAAIRFLSEALKSRTLSNPELVEAYHFRGIAYSRSGLHDLATEDFQAAIRLSPDSGLLYYSKGNNLFRQGKLDEALRDLSQAIELLQYPDAYALRGKIFLDRGKLDSAIQDLTKAIEIKPNEARYFYRRGSASWKKGDYDLAVNDFTKAIQLTQNWARDYFYARGLAQNRLGNYDLAVHDFSRVLQRHPSDVDAIFGRAASNGGLGRKKEDMRDLNRVIEVDPTYARAYFNRAGLQAQLGNYDAALADLEKSVFKEPDLRPLVSFVRGWVFFLQERYSEAKNEFKKSHEIGMSTVAGEESLFWLYTIQERLGKDGSGFLGQIQKREERDDWATTLASLLQGDKLPESILTNIEENAVLTNPQKQVRRCEAHFFLGEVYLKNGQKKQAVKSFALALDTEAFSSPAYTAAQIELNRLNGNLQK